MFCDYFHIQFLKKKDSNDSKMLTKRLSNKRYKNKTVIKI